VQVTTTFDFDLSETITSGSVVYSGSYNGMPFSQDADLCTEVAKSGDPCPLSVGHHKQVSTATADYTGKVETKINWTTTDGRAILCADVTVSPRLCSVRAARQPVLPSRLAQSNQPHSFLPPYVTRVCRSRLHKRTQTRPTRAALADGL